MGAIYSLHAEHASLFAAACYRQVRRIVCWFERAFRLFCMEGKNFSLLNSQNHIYGLMAIRKLTQKFKHEWNLMHTAISILNSIHDAASSFVEFTFEFAFAFAFASARVRFIHLPVFIDNLHSRTGSFGPCSALQASLRASVQVSRQVRMWTCDMSIIIPEYIHAGRAFQGIYGSQEPEWDKHGWIIVNTYTHTHTHTHTSTNKFSLRMGHCSNQCGTCSGSSQL